MKYELAKELKDAGFPQKPKYGELFYHPEKGFLPTTMEMQNKPLNAECLRFPTISELIEVCGNNFVWLHRAEINNVAIFVAQSFWPEQGIASQGIGHNPEEAVAKLWLELNNGGGGKRTDAI